jgi:hypothetical protein
MPVYSYKCPQCRDERKEVLYSVHSKHIAPYCKNCGGMMIKSYQDMIPAIHDLPVDSIDMDITGKPIRFHTKGQLKRLAKEHGCEVA